MRRLSLILSFLFLLVLGDYLRAGQLDWGTSFSIPATGSNGVKFGVRLVNSTSASVTVAVLGSAVEVHAASGKIGKGSIPNNTYSRTIAAGGNTYLYFDVNRDGGSGTQVSAVNLKFGYTVNGGSLQQADVVVLPAGSTLNLSTGGIYGVGFVFPDVQVAPFIQPGGTLRLMCAVPRVAWVQLGSTNPFTVNVTTQWQEFPLTGEGLLVVRAVNQSGAELVPAQSLLGQWGVVSLNLPAEIAGTVSFTNNGPAVTVQPKSGSTVLGEPVSLSTAATYVWQVAGSVFTPLLQNPGSVQFWADGQVIGAGPIVWDTASAWHAASTSGVLDEPGAGRIQFNYRNESGIGRTVQIKLGGAVMAEGQSGADGSFISSFVTVHEPQYDTEYQVLVDGQIVRQGMTPAQQEYNPEFPVPGGYDILLTYTSPSDVDNIQDPESPDYDGTVPGLTLPPAEGTPERSDYDTMRRAMRDALRDGGQAEGVPSFNGDGETAAGAAPGGALGSTLSDGIGRLRDSIGELGSVPGPSIVNSPTLTIWERAPNLGGPIQLDLSGAAAAQWASVVREVLLVLVRLAGCWAIFAVARKAFL